jgi:hypothetical protein
LLEPDRQPVAIGTILKPSRPVDHLPDDPFEAEFEKRAIMDFEQPIRDVDSEIGVDPDQVGVEGRMMHLLSGVDTEGAAVANLSPGRTQRPLETPPSWFSGRPVTFAFARKSTEGERKNDIPNARGFGGYLLAQVFVRYEIEKPGA